MHWNENGNREQAAKSDGTLQYRIAFPKATQGQGAVKKVLKQCTYGKISFSK